MVGDLVVHSNPCRGSEFKFRIPIKVGHEPKGKQKLTCASLEFRVPKTLVVEDNPTNLLITKAFLKSINGIVADVAIDGQEALDKFRSKNYELIFMDCQMPRMDGYESTKHIKNINCGTDPIIIAIGPNVYAHNIEKCRKSGMDDHLGKPLKKVDLKEKLIKWFPAIANGSGTSDKSTRYLEDT